MRLIVLRYIKGAVKSTPDYFAVFSAIVWNFRTDANNPMYTTITQSQHLNTLQHYKVITYQHYSDNVQNRSLNAS